MKETNTITKCERGDELVSFLYGETNEPETAEFEKHLQRCGDCRSELASFNRVRESITMWKDEALFASLPPRVQLGVREKSALGALRQFFDLSPLWLKGAVGLAAVALCVLAVMAVVSSPRVPRETVASSAEGRYSEEDMKRAVAAALKKQAEELAASTQKPAVTPAISVKEPRKQLPKPSNSATRWARTTKPLSRSEREQLANDLRLITTNEDDLHLLGDRMNQEF